MSTNQNKKKETELSNSQNTKLSPTTQSQGAAYVESDAVKQAKNNLASLQKPGEYQSSWQQSLNDVIGRIQNREKFTYDLNGDALYQQYKNQFVNQGQQAMMDTMGQASALTGGYGNSYAQSVGQQTYQGYLQQLNDKVPELYQIALDQYNRETEDLYNQYGLYADREDTDYGRYRDTVSDYNTERDYLTNQYQTERDFDYGKHIDERDYAYQVARDTVADNKWQTEYDRGVYEFDTQFDYQKDRDSVADKQWQSEFDESVRQFDTNVALTREEMEIQQKQWQAEFNESVRQYNKDYELAKADIAEKVRHNKITEEQAAKELDLAKKELAQRKQEAQQDYLYKMADIAQRQKAADQDYKYKMASIDTTPDSPVEPEEPDYSGFGAMEWTDYFAAIRLDKNGGGQAEAEQHLLELSRQGVIPKKHLAAARIGASGSLGH